MTRVEMKCIVCGSKFEDELTPYINGRLELCKGCRRKREIYKMQKEFDNENN